MCPVQRKEMTFLSMAVKILGLMLEQQTDIPFYIEQ